MASGDSDKPKGKKKIFPADIKMPFQGGTQGLTKLLGNFTKSSTQQLLVGSASGWVTGFLTLKIGKTAAFAAGGTVIAMQLAQNHGYMKSSWEQVSQKARTSPVGVTVTEKTPAYINQIKQYGKKNPSFAAGFIGGFLLGIAT